MRYRYFVDFWHGVSEYANFSYGIAVLGTYQCPPLARRCSPTSSHFFRSADPYTRCPVTSVGMYVTKYKQPQAANIQSTWRLAEAEFIIINRNNIKLFHFTISGDRKIVFLNLYSRICLDPAAVRTNERCHATTFPRFNSPIKADGNFEFFSFSANLSFSFHF